jgi:hypothetical protein
VYHDAIDAISHSSRSSGNGGWRSILLDAMKTVVGIISRRRRTIGLIVLVIAFARLRKYLWLVI